MNESLEIQVQDLLTRPALVADIRSPGEYSADHIPGAVNIPLFDDQERAIIGTLYKQIGQDQAIQKGVELVSPKLQDFYNAFKDLRAPGLPICLYCFRGGMRSQAALQFLKGCQLPGVFRLAGGYKAYRRHVNHFFSQPDRDHRYCMIHGHTGTGKTEVLEALSKKGASVIDLEALACNSGSVFGTLLFDQAAPSQKWFESTLYHRLRHLSQNPVFIESESRKIGRVLLPPAFYQSINQDRHILLTGSYEARAQRLARQYAADPGKRPALRKALAHLTPALGKKRTEEVAHCIEQEQYQQAAFILLLEYYDPLYSHSQDLYQYECTLSGDDPEKAAQEILERCL